MYLIHVIFDIKNFESLILIIFLLFQIQSTLEITIPNIKVTNRAIRVAVYKNSSDFLEDKGIFMSKEIIPAKVGIFKLSLNDLSYGEYVIAIYQDVNNNGKLDKNIFGAPSEPYGFSQNFKPKFSAPKFNDCMIYFDQNNTKTTIKLLY